MDNVVDQLLLHVKNCDLKSLRDLWELLETRVFQRMTQDDTVTLKKMHSSLLKAYLVQCSLEKDAAKITNFFTENAELVTARDSEWTDWFGECFEFVLFASW